MADFIAEQADFILFFYGLAFILLGITCFAIARSAADAVAWTWLGSFGLVHGASEWLDLYASDEFPMRFCRAGTLLRESHPVVKAHPWAFAPARAHTEPAA